MSPAQKAELEEDETEAQEDAAWAAALEREGPVDIVPPKL